MVRFTRSVPNFRHGGNRMIEIRKGDITEPIWPDTNRIIVHCVNSAGVMGAGVALALCTKWPAVRDEYLSWYNQNDNTFQLGSIQNVEVEEGIEVINLVGQKHVGDLTFSHLDIKLPPARYEALYEGFLRVRDMASQHIAEGEKEQTIHLPLLGSALAGGDFRKVYQKYLKAFKGSDIRTCFYAYSDKDFDYLKKVYEGHNV